MGEVVTRLAFSPRLSTGQLGAMAEKVPTQPLVESIECLGVPQDAFEKIDLAELQSQIQQLPPESGRRTKDRHAEHSRGSRSH